MNAHDTVLGAFIATISQALLTLFGVDYYAMLWAFVGTLFAMTQSTMTRPRAIIYVVLSTFMGAAFGSAAVDIFESARKSYLVGLSLIGGFGSQLIISAALQVVLARIANFGGAPNDKPPSPSP